jgi:hypothetical protein
MKDKPMHFILRPPILPAAYENNPPISSSMRTFDLTIRTLCDFRSLDFILHCMPNLRRFIVFINYPSNSAWWRDVFDGYKWQELLTRNTSHLDVFDISLHIYGLNLVLDVDSALKSFDYFSRKYDDWYLGIHRARFSSNSDGKIREELIY